MTGKFVMARSTKWNRANPDKVRRYQREWTDRRRAARIAEVEAKAVQAAQAALLAAQEARTCQHCGGQFISHWGDVACLQCGRAPVAARVLAPEEEPSYSA